VKNKKKSISLLSNFDDITTIFTQCLYSKSPFLTSTVVLARTIEARQEYELCDKG
jgi:hypothetical protein